MEETVKRKHKKKDNFMRRTKHHAKKGTFGQGHTLTNDQYAYYINILELMKNVEGQEKELLVQNFLIGIIEEQDGKKLASNQIVSRILDDALQCGEVLQVLALTRIFSEDIRTTCIDPYASHVLQTLMSLSLKFAQKPSVQKETKDEDETENEEDPKSVPKEIRTQFSSFLMKIGRFVFNNLDEFILDTYGSHVFRSVLETCSGVQVKNSIKSSQKSQTNHSLCHNAGQILRIPPKLKKLLAEIADRLLMLPALPEIITNDRGSAALQSALLVLKGTDSERCSALVDHILSNGFPNITPRQCDNDDEFSELPQVFQSSPAVHLLEVLMPCASVDQLNQIYSGYFKGHMLELVKHHIGNFAVQKLLLSWQEKDTFYEQFEEVKEVLPAALEVKNTGILFALAQACRKLEKSQGQCWKVMTQLLECYEPQERQLAAAPCLLWFLKYDEYMEKKAAGKLPPMSLHGSLILQEFLKYIRTIKIVESILGMDVADLQLMAADPRGSHVLDAFHSSSFIKVNNKEKLIGYFKGTYAALACTRHGSRSLEAMWNVASIKLKTEMCEELVNEEFKLMASQHGLIIYTNFKVQLFKKKDKEDWQQLVDSAAKKKRMLDELISDVTEDKPKKKKKIKKGDT